LAILAGMKTPLKPLRFGPIEVDFPIVLAALAGYSDLPFRLLCRSLGAPFCTTEALLDRQVMIEKRVRRRMTKLDEADHPVAGQIMGNEPEVMAEAAAKLSDMGFDVIDLNFACPVRKVVSKKRGGFLMSRPGEVLEIIRAVVKAVPDRPVTVKLRRSFREADRSGDDFREIARGSFEAGVAAVTVHARSVEQKYKGRADWEFLALVKREFPDRTIIGSGDVHTAADALRMIEATGVDGVSAARGAIGNPWLFQQARDLAAGREPCKPDIAAQREVILRHYELAQKFFDPKRAIHIIHNFGIRYAKVHSQPTKVRAAFYTIKTEAQLMVLLDAWYR
jgi:tRNA-dihydrouridine synthase B